MNLHQRSGRRQGLPTNDDPTTPVFNPAYGSGNNGSSPYVGYGGGGHTSNTMNTAHTNGSLSYGGYAGGGGGGNSGSSSHVNNIGGGYKDKMKRKKQNIILQKLQDPLFLVTLVAFFFMMTTIRYKLQHQHSSKGNESMYAISREKSDLQRELKTMKESYKKQLLDSNKLQADLIKLKKNHPEAARLQQEADVEKAKMEAREKAWKDQYELLRASVQKESRRSVIEK
jgi:hypothetical protein